MKCHYYRLRPRSNRRQGVVVKQGVLICALTLKDLVMDTSDLTGLDGSHAQVEQTDCNNKCGGLEGCLGVQKCTLKNSYVHPYL